MGFFAGYVLGSGGNSSSSSSGELGGIIIVLIAYHKLKQYCAANEDKLLFFFMIYIGLLILIWRFSYRLSIRSVLAIIIREILRFLVIPLSLILGLMVTSKIGGTPLQHMITWIDSISNFGTTINFLLASISLVIFVVDFIFRMYFFKFIETFFALEHK